ncbi:quinate permease [Ilyonectria robusta]|uniref:quinate permease n=1 Tax=Ilyonectria robusta TaxID=1079257 RepID=UPI001E8DBCBA|nr:quinate permease [Ilyonectria robusta]KAH8672429.1 quinate permease [Ilyonectria robusta]
MGITHADNNEPPEVRNWTIHWVAIVASMAALALGYDTAVIGGTMALDSFVRDFGLEGMSDHDRDDTQANIVSTFQLGAFLGAFCTFPIAEKVGRRKAVLFACLVFMLGASLMTASRGHVGMIIAGRAIGGFGIGSATLTVPVYIAEVAPPSIRGRLVGIFEVTSQTGSMLGFWINYATDRTIDVKYSAQWIVPLGLQLLPVTFLACGIFFCPESPRWLARKDRFDETEKVLVYLRGLPSDHPFIMNEMAEIRQQVEQRSTVRLSKMEQLKKLTAKGTRNRVGVGAFLMFLQSFTGVNIMTYYSPRIFESLGVVGTTTKLFSTGIYGVAKMLGMVVFTLFVVEGLGRRKGLIYGALLGCLPLWYVGGYVFKADPATAAAAGVINRDGWSYFAMVCIYLNAFIICATWQGITWTYAAEIFPLDIRMLCVALTTASTWIGSFFIARVTPFMITGLGYGTYFVFGGVVILMGIWAFFFVPETRGLSLEAMDALFMQPTHKAVWKQLRGKPIIPNETRSDNDSIKGEKREIENVV